VPDDQHNLGSVGERMLRAEVIAKNFNDTKNATKAGGGAGKTPMIEGLKRGRTSLPKAGALPGCATPRDLIGQGLIGILAGSCQEQKRGDSGLVAEKRHQKRHQIPALFR
jgi:hypothetical protein